MFLARCVVNETHRVVHLKAKAELWDTKWLTLCSGLSFVVALVTNNLTKLTGMTMTLSLQRTLKRTPCHPKKIWNSKYNKGNWNSKNPQGMRDSGELQCYKPGVNQPVPPVPCTKHSPAEPRGLSVRFSRYTLQVWGERASWTGAEHRLSSLRERYRNVIKTRLLKNNNDPRIKVLSYGSQDKSFISAFIIKCLCENVWVRRAFQVAQTLEQA